MRRGAAGGFVPAVVRGVLGTADGGMDRRTIETTEDGGKDEREMRRNTNKLMIELSDLDLRWIAEAAKLDGTDIQDWIPAILSGTAHTRIEEAKAEADLKKRTTES